MALACSHPSPVAHPHAHLPPLLPHCRAKIGKVVPEAKDPDTGKPADSEGPFAGKRMDTLMGAVVTVAVAIMAVCLVKRPQALGGLLRKLFARA
jgi:hypothetical protein